MKRHLLVHAPSVAAAAMALAACGPLSAQRHGDCDVRRTVELDLPTTGIDLVDITARAGSLDVEGAAATRTIQVTATICASDDERMEGLDVSLERSSSRALVETIFPERDRGWRDGYARIDLTVRVPHGMDARVTDGSGHANISGVGALDVDDGSGHLVLRDIDGEVDIEDGSGHVEIYNVAGSVRLDDGSGIITISGVDGSVTLHDGSGTIEIDNVTANVDVREKGSGTIEVRDIEGNFRVSGTRRERIQFDNVGGTLDLPAPRRRGRKGN